MNFYNEIDKEKAEWLRELIARDLIPFGVVDERSIEDITPGELVEYTQCHFFCGIGIFPYALREAGYGDTPGIFTGSVPCQSFSQVGKRKGFADERHLWPAFHYLIEQRRPRVVIGEMVHSKDGEIWVDLVQDDLEGIGFTVGAFVAPAACVGAFHKRDRIYFVAENGVRNSVEKGLEGYAGNVDPIQESGRNKTNAGRSTTTSSGLDYWTEGGVEWRRCRPEPRFPSGSLRPLQPGCEPMVNGNSTRMGRGGDSSSSQNTSEARDMRLKGYGDAICAPLAIEFIKSYFEIL